MLTRRHEQTRAKRDEYVVSTMNKFETQYDQIDLIGLSSISAVNITQQRLLDI